MFVAIRIQSGGQRENNRAKHDPGDPGLSARDLP